MSSDGFLMPPIHSSHHTLLTSAPIKQEFVGQGRPTISRGRSEQENPAVIGTEESGYRHYSGDVNATAPASLSSIKVKGASRLINGSWMPIRSMHSIKEE